MDTKNTLGLIQVYYGDGKGKTTAALGQAIRAFGNGKKVGLIYFDKGGDDYNERKVLDKLGIPYFSFGRNRRRDNGTFDFSFLPDDLEMAKESMAILREIDEEFDLIVLDEVLNCIRLKMMEAGEIVDYIKTEKPKNLELILTGRGLSDEIKEIADLITEMKLHKHYMYNGVPAREGIEW
jgi:cob(I)alamin adenosyltransferase